MNVNLAVDAMGGDKAPSVVLDGVKAALDADKELSITLCGPTEVVGSFCEQTDRCIPAFASEVISMGEHPAKAVRAKKDSSIVVGCKLVRDGKADGFFSAGSTGACLAASTLIIGRINGVKRPGLGIVLPSYERPCFLMDVGANADCKPEYLCQFALMGKAYMQSIMGVTSPKVGLLNIGEEKEKGSQLALDSYDLLSSTVEGFEGNCEGGDLMEGKFDVVVTDGFTGNVCLKTIEGTSKVLFKYVKAALTSTTKAKLGAMLVKSNLAELKETVNPDRYGGTPLLGVKGVSVIGHGSAGSVAIKNGIAVAAKSVREGLVEMISESMKQATSEAGDLN